MIYLDNAATSWPKPPEVLKAMTDVLEKAGGNPGRSGHSLSIESGRVMYDARETIADFFNAPDPMRVIFTPNVTYALNTALLGILRPGDRVVTTSMEHNAVMRPLRYLEKSGVTIDVVPCDSRGVLDLRDMEHTLQKPARLVVANHASNVAGTILPVADIAVLVRRAGALFLVDAAQTAGVLPIDVQRMGIDLLGFTGHKGLLGPPGTGGLILGPGVDPVEVAPLVRGGTGSRSESQEQPDYLPDRYESGTPNVSGIAGLKAGVEWLCRRNLEAIREHEKNLARKLLEGLSAIHGVIVHGTSDPEQSTAIISITMPGKRVSEIGQMLNEDHEILTRVGLHCAPAAHTTLGTYPEGTVRLAPGICTTMADIDVTLQAIQHTVRS